VLASKNRKLKDITGVAEKELLDMLDQMGVQVFIKGSVNATEQTLDKSMFPENFKSVRATINLEVLNGANARVMASLSKNQAAALISTYDAQVSAVGRATKSISKELASTVIARWGELVNNGFEYDVTIAGVSFGETGDILDALNKNIEGVKKVIERPYNKNLKAMNVLIRYIGSCQNLICQILANGKLSIKLDLEDNTSKSMILKKIQ
jgi:hypothetical protein